MTGELLSWLIRETERNDRRVRVSLFVGPDADHRALAGTLVLDPEQADDLTMMLTGWGERKRVQAERVG